MRRREAITTHATGTVAELLQVGEVSDKVRAAWHALLGMVILVHTTAGEPAMAAFIHTKG
jgi:hypothetical protein